MRRLRWIAALLVGVAAGWISVDLLREAYSAGPPLYGRTVNKDKWVSLWPVVLPVAGLGAMVAFLLVPRRRARR